jgi:hypothetical protein
MRRELSREEMIGEIDIMISDIGLTEITSIAFALMQRCAEKIAQGNQQIELQEMKAMQSSISDAFDDEINALMGGDQREYRATEE